MTLSCEAVRRCVSLCVVDTSFCSYLYHQWQMIAPLRCFAECATYDTAGFEEMPYLPDLQLAARFASLRFATVLQSLEAEEPLLRSVLERYRDSEPRRFWILTAPSIPDSCLCLREAQSNVTILFQSSITHQAL
ncbi:unnamed protein product [Polarella glacialis]|uniref:Uncharacterized protein n=1 Tax=Polarella glacialis TaxID=89957 RepID=A0A813KAW5_POLGL|nr:unnamed protein product [Polarella glacialis]